VAKGRSESHEIRVMVAIVSTKADWTLPVLWYKWQYTGITELLLFLCPIQTKVEDVLMEPGEGKLQVRFCEWAHSNLGANIPTEGGL
jgi:hypothetical protein